jgi:hypothetical protein
MLEPIYKTTQCHIAKDSEQSEQRIHFPIPQSDEQGPNIYTAYTGASYELHNAQNTALTLVNFVVKFHKGWKHSFDVTPLQKPRTSVTVKKHQVKHTSVILYMRKPSSKWKLSIKIQSTNFSISHVNGKANRTGCKQIQAAHGLYTHYSGTFITDKHNRVRITFRG